MTVSLTNMPTTDIADNDLIELLYQDKSGGLTVNPAALENYFQGCNNLGQLPVFSVEQLPETVEESVSQWRMPESYQNIDLDVFFAHKVNNLAEAERVSLELALFRERNMEQLLKFMIYLVDVMKENNIVWGVGRGSSVSSFLLFLVGLHSINPIKYELDIREFIR